MKIDSLNSSSIDVFKNEFNPAEKALLVSIIVLIIIESVLLTLLLTGVGSALPLTISLCVFLVILVVLAIVLLISYFEKEKFFKVKKPEPPETLPSPPPPPSISTVFKTLIPSYKEQKVVGELLSKYNETFFLLNILQKLSLTESLNMHMEVVSNPDEMIRAGSQRSELEQWVKSKICSLAYLSSYSPPGDGNCLVNSIIYAMRKHALEISGPLVLRTHIVRFLKENLLKDNVCLKYILSEVVECICALDTFSVTSLDEKKATICQKCSLFSSEISKHTVSLNVLPGNNITSYLTIYNNKEIKNKSFLLDFLEMHSMSGIFLGPSAVHALAYQLGVTIFLYTHPLLTESTLILEGEISSNDLSLHITANNGLSVGGPDWEKNIMVFNPEAQSENPICLGLLVNHFVCLNMEEKL